MLALTSLIVPTLVALKFGLSILALALFPSALVAVPLAFHDVKSRLLPNRFIYPAIIATLLVIIGFAVNQSDIHKLWQPLSSALLISGIALVFHVFLKNSLGAGDVKLLFLVGLNLGVFTTAHALMALLITAVSVLMFALTLLISNKASAKTKIAFGPFILAGSWVTILLFG
jgi:leader peptidase (prepilin peptidase)/N-methyltransferase